MSQVEHEEHEMIIRLPDEIADLVREEINSDQIEVTDLMEIEPFIDEQNGEIKHKFKFKYGDFESTASLVDLPCVIESHKTIDDVNFYKCQNISEMILVHPNGQSNLEDLPNFNSIAKKIVESEGENKNKVKYLAKNGLTPPTVDIRNRYFRKEFPITREEISEVEEDMYELLKTFEEKSESVEENEDEELFNEEDY